MSKIYNADFIGKKESVVDEILLLNPNKIPMLNLVGFAAPVAQTTHQWFEDEVFAQTSNASAGKLATDTAVVVDSVEAFRADQVVKIGEELLLVTAVDSSTKTLTVVRGYAGTTAAAIAAGAELEVMFSETEEGMDARSSRYKKRTPHSNITQIFTDSIRVTGTAQEIEQYGIDDIYSYEKAKVQLNLALELEKAIINGVQYENGSQRYLKGIRQYVKSNVIDAAGSAITDAKINDLAESVFTATGVEAAGGNYKLVVAPNQKRKISDFGKAEIRLDRKDNGRGQVVDFYTSDFGEFEIVMNPNIGADEAFLVDANRVAVRPMKNREFFHKFLGDKGDYVEGMITGEYTLELLQEKAFARLKGLSK